MADVVVNGRLGERSTVNARIAVLLVGFVVVGVVAGGIFDQRLPVLVAAALAPTIVALVVFGRSAPLRIVGAVLAVVISVAAAVLSEGGGLVAFVEAFTEGAQGLLSTEWPSPVRAELVGTVAGVIAVAAVIADELAARRRFHLAGLLPLAAAYLGAVALSAPRGPAWWSIIALAAVGLVFAALPPADTLSNRIELLRGERRLIPLVVLAVVLVTAVAIPVSLPARADPRRADPPASTAPLLDPIEAARALRNLDPPIDLHVVTAAEDATLPDRWRTAALVAYDGQRWSPGLTLRPIGTTLGVATGPVVDADVSFLRSNLDLVPLPGPPVSVDADIETDAARTVVRLADAPQPGHVVGIVANGSPTITEAIEVGIATSPVDEAVTPFGDLARNLAGEGTPFEQLARLEATMREDFVLDSEVQGGGLQIALVERFLRDTQRGTPEQFATGFALLARSLGIVARVATGYIVDPSADSTVTLRSSDATVWPEIQLADGRWLAYDPAPDDEATDGEPPPPEPQVQTPAAPQPPIPPPPDPDTETTDPDEVTTTEQASTLSRIVVWALRGTLVATLLALPFAIAAVVIVGLKLRRRRRRLHAAEPAERIRGAWASATDALVDAGLDIAASSTDHEIADRGVVLATEAERDLKRLATWSSAATYGAPRHVDVLADNAVACLDAVEDAIGDGLTRWQRWRWQLSVRSLRSATRSPVDVRPTSGVRSG